MSETFRCGHPRTPANTYASARTDGRKDERCRVCETARRKTFVRHKRLALLKARLSDC